MEHALADPYVDGGQPSQGRNAGGLEPFPPRPLAATLLAAKLSQAESRYLYHRLPMRQPPTTGTVRAHIGQLPALYRDLADGTRSALSVMEGREQERNRLLAALADGLAERYEGLVLCLPAGRVENIIRLNRGEERVSKFWERVLEQVEVCFIPDPTQLWLSFFFWKHGTDQSLAVERKSRLHCVECMGSALRYADVTGVGRIGSRVPSRE